MFSFLKKKISWPSGALKNNLDPVTEVIERSTSDYSASSESLVEKPSTWEQLKQENETQVFQLFQLQEQLEKTFLSEQELKVQTVSLQDLVKKNEAEYQVVSNKLADEKQEMIHKISQLESEKFNTEKQIILKTDQLEKQTLALGDLKKKYASIEDQKKQFEVQSVNLLLEKNILSSELSELKKVNQDAQKKLEQKVIDQEQKNELLLLQMYQLQEEVEQLFLDKNKIQQSYDLQLVRWIRLEKILPNYIHFEKIELLSVEDLANETIGLWRIHDYYQGGISYEHLDFQLKLKEGDIFIGLGHEIDLKLAFCPRLVFSDPVQQKQFRSISSTDWRKLSHITNILGALIQNRWSGLIHPKTVDLIFWHSSLVDLVKQFKKLPQVLRYSRVALKRELHNIDYEHLWLDLSDVEFGTISIPKLDLRIGAAMVRPDGFSRHPKFEFPLINRKDKPFESWYPESNDDQGPKYEVRYDLDRKAFDLEALKKLSNNDRSLVLNLILLTPKMIEDLMAQRIAIHRPWVSWSNLVQEAVQFTSLLLQNSQAARTQRVDKQAEGSRQAELNSVLTKNLPSKPKAGVKQKVVRKAVVAVATKNTKKVMSIKPKAKLTKTTPAKSRKK
jgi:hypothetical protein